MPEPSFKHISPFWSIRSSITNPLLSVFSLPIEYYGHWNPQITLLVMICQTGGTQTQDWETGQVNSTQEIFLNVRSASPNPLRGRLAEGRAAWRWRTAMPAKCWAAGVWLQTGQAAGVWLQTGQAAGVWLQTGQAAGVWLQTGQAAGVWLQTGQDAGVWLQTGQAAGVWLQTGQAAGVGLQIGQSTTNRSERIVHSTARVTR